MANSTTQLLTADQAEAGATLNVYVAILNNMTEGTIYGEPLLFIDGVQVAEGAYRAIVPEPPVGPQHPWEMTEYGLMYADSWKFQFVMPAKSVVVRVESWIEQEAFGIPWHKDSTASKPISLVTVPAPAPAPAPAPVVEVPPAAIPAPVYTCPYCTAQFTTESALYEHIRTAHAAQPVAVIYVCPVCGAQFSTSEGFQYHYRSVHAVPAAEVPPAVEVAEKTAWEVLWEMLLPWLPLEGPPLPKGFFPAWPWASVVTAPTTLAAPKAKEKIVVYE